LRYADRGWETKGRKMEAETKWIVKNGRHIGPALKVLIVDDDRMQLEALRIALGLRGHECLDVSNVEDAYTLMHSWQGESVDLILSDMSMPGGSGLELARRMRNLRPGLPIIVITGLRSSPSLETVKKMGIPILQKPFDPERLYATIQSLTD
jgi:DNA-binding NtrC family response regulator